MSKLWRYWMKSLALELQKEMTYKLNFFFKVIGIVLADVVAPLVTLLIYRSTPGIPGWEFEEIILFQGSFILVFGLSRMLFMSFPGRVIEAVRDGSFDKYMVKPINPLLQLTLMSWDIEGSAEALTGLGLVVWSTTKVGVTLPNMLLYVPLILLGCLFVYSLMVVIAALAFLVVKSWALYDIFLKLSDFGRYPITIYEGGLRFMLTFIFPIGVVAFYPARSILVAQGWQLMTHVVLPIGGVFLISLLLWRQAMRKYTSAGG